MRLLLDTQLLLWAASEPEKLSQEAQALIADTLSQLIFSAISVWEVAIKSSRGRQDFSVDAWQFRRALLDNDYQELTITSAHAAATGTLPPIHKDPFDRLLVSQALAEGVTLLTADPVIAQYPAPVRLI